MAVMIRDDKTKLLIEIIIKVSIYKSITCVCA